jgi:DNA (cytosine-5)-methyltransferase 1
MAAYYSENDKFAAAWLRNLISKGLIPDGHVDDRSIVDVQPGDLRGYRHVHMFAGIGGWALAARLAGWPDDRGLWTGSCPCQPFSVAGKGGGTDDARHLWPDFFRLIRACRPACVMGEQVARKAGFGWFDGVRSDLESINYASRAIDIPACAVDAPHIRSRLWWCAVADAGLLDRGSRPGQSSDGQEPADLHVGSPTADAVRGGPATHGRDNHEIGGVPEKECKPGYDASLSGRSNAAAIRGVADASSQGRDAAAQRGICGEAQGEWPRHGEPERPHGIHGGGMVNTPSIGRGEGQPEPMLRGGRPTVGGADVSNRSMGNADNPRELQSQGCVAGQRRWPLHTDGSLGHANGAGRQGSAAHGRDDGDEQSAVKRTDVGHRPNGSFWSDAEWIICHDQKARRTKPGLPLLVNGVPGRVALWRGFGNAISPVLAAEVLKAYLECCP